MFGPLTVKSSDLDLFYNHGAVHGSKTWSESHVHGSGGGNNTNVKISTTVTTRNQFFLVDSSGVEHSVSLNGEIPFRDSNVATVVYVKFANKDTGRAIYFKNHSTRDIRSFNGVSELFNAGGCLSYLAIGFIGFITVGVAGPIGPLLALGVIGYGIMNVRKVQKEMVVQAAQLANGLPS